MPVAQSKFMTDQFIIVLSVKQRENRNVGTAGVRAGKIKHLHVVS